MAGHEVVLLRFCVLYALVDIGQPQTQVPVVPEAAVPGALSDYEVCARSFPGEQGYPLNRVASQASGRWGGVKFGINSLASGLGPTNPCVVQCRTASGNVWAAAKPWGTPCILHGEQRFCAANVCVLRNDTYLEYCRQNFQTTNEVVALTPYMCTLECIDLISGIVLKVRMTDGTPCRANTGRGYETGFCYSGGCSVLMFPYMRRIFPLRFGSLLG